MKNNSTWSLISNASSQLITKQISILEWNSDRKVHTRFKRRDSIGNAHEPFQVWSSSTHARCSLLNPISKAQNPYKFFNVRCLFGNLKTRQVRQRTHGSTACVPARWQDPPVVRCSSSSQVLSSFQLVWAVLQGYLPWFLLQDYSLLRWRASHPPNKKNNTKHGLEYSNFVFFFNSKSKPNSSLVYDPSLAEYEEKSYSIKTPM